jgi:pimeloyl-ACP methyl ester carboxylesterase
MRQIVAPKGGQCGAAPKILAIPMVQAYRFSVMGSPCELQIYAENHAVAERVANLAMADLRKAAFEQNRSAIGRSIIDDHTGQALGQSTRGCAKNSNGSIPGHGPCKTGSGLVVQLLLQKDLAAAGVAIESAPPMGVFTVKWSFLKSNWPHITPFVSQSSPVEMTFENFQHTVKPLPLEEQRAAYGRYFVPESRRVPRGALTARVDFKKPHPPLLLIAGSDDVIIPASPNKALQPLGS